ncbi:hypothetical protein EJ03DRAFT_334800 [Teratosphaeria nubilosa]|uniref:Uncharacterized protein n=1 Tax=Teratosphaeria nubilosa TaxID=161662 RepID=A0A6G1LF73_9PEZI|nr:hypothetical protein EJ03DRAFT_334800 [Teratosphaeria nubilosa]
MRELLWLSVELLRPYGDSSDILDVLELTQMLQIRLLAALIASFRFSDFVVPSWLTTSGAPKTRSEPRLRMTSRNLKPQYQTQEQPRQSSTPNNTKHESSERERRHVSLQAYQNHRLQCNMWVDESDQTHLPSQEHEMVWQHIYRSYESGQWDHKSRDANWLYGQAGTTMDQIDARRELGFQKSSIKAASIPMSPVHSPTRLG